jgi:putative DNA primase/helicase
MANNKTVDILALVEKATEEIQKVARFATLKDTGDIYQWQNGIWVNSGEIRIKEFTEALVEHASQYIVSEVVAKIKRKTYIDRSLFDSDDTLINTKNSVINLKTGEVTEHAPEQYQTIQFPITYNPIAICPVIDSFVAEVMGDNAKVFYEILAYCTIPDYRFKKFFIFLGEANTGKTTAVDLMYRFLGKSNTSEITLQQLADNRFAMSNLYGKLANICDDLPKVAFEDVGKIKQLTGNSPIGSEVKHVQKPVNFVNRAKLIFTCNTIPKTNGSDDAFFSRILIIPFRYQPAVIDNDLISKLTTEDEMSGLLNRVLEARKFLYKNNGFSITQSVSDVSYLYSVGALDTITQYTYDRIEYDVLARVLKEDIYNDYLKYCNEKNIPAKADNAFHRRLQEMYHLETVQVIINNEHKRAYMGIKLKEV